MWSITALHHSGFPPDCQTHFMLNLLLATVQSCSCPGSQNESSLFFKTYCSFASLSLSLSAASSFPAADELQPKSSFVMLTCWNSRIYRTRKAFKSKAKPRFPTKIYFFHYQSKVPLQNADDILNV